MVTTKAKLFLWLQESNSFVFQNEVSASINFVGDGKSTFTCTFRISYDLQIDTLYITRIDNSQLVLIQQINNDMFMRFDSVILYLHFLMYKGTQEYYMVVLSWKYWMLELVSYV